MATRAERTAVYQGVVTALEDAAYVDGFMEHVAIAKAMDALGVVISDVDPSVAAQAIAFRNGPLLRECQPVDVYLQQDPEPVVWLFNMEQVLTISIHATDYENLRGLLIAEAHRLVAERCSYALQGFSSRWIGKAEVDDKYFVVTLYPSHDWYAEHVDDGQCCDLHPEPEQTPEGLLPTILVGFDETLGMGCKGGDTVKVTLIMRAHGILKYRKPAQYAKLTDDWWGEVAATDIGYLVTFHYSREGPGDE